MIGLIAGEEIEVEARLEDRPFAAILGFGEDIAEQLLGPRAVQEMLLVRRALVSIAGRDGDAVGAKLGDGVEEIGDAIGLGIAEQVQLMLTRKPRALAVCSAATALS